MRVAGNTPGSLECGAMPTRIVFAGGETILVAEDLDVVVKALEDISPNAADPCASRARPPTRIPGTVEGKPVNVRPQAVLYVTPT